MRISDWSSDVCSSDLALPILETGQDQDEEQFTQEFRVASAHDGKFNWVAGFFYYDRRYFQNTILDLGSGFLGPGLRNTVQAMAETEARSHALFGSGEYTINDRMTADIALRFPHESTEAHNEKTASRHTPGFI